ncbi:MAG: universal stress protein [Pseudonocardia sp.]|nr:universal stress protein [Pseudonocardia sp.]
MGQRAGRTIVVGVDGSDSTLAAVRWAATEASRWRAPLRCWGGVTGLLVGSVAVGLAVLAWATSGST